MHGGIGALEPAEHGLISPGVFIPLAEQTGLINPIGEWVLRTACNQAKACSIWTAPVHISVNVSVLQLRNSRFVSIVEDILRKPDWSLNILTWRLQRPLL